MRAFLALALVALLAGCSGGAALQSCLASVAALPAPGSQAEALNLLTADSTLAAGCRFADADRKLRLAISVRNEALHLAKRLHDRGILDDAQIEKVREAGKASRLALNAAVSALAAAREANASGTWLSAFADAQDAIADLVALAGGSDE